MDATAELTPEATPEPTPKKSMSEAILAKAGKLRIADHARLLADNQQTLNQVNKQDRQARDLHGRIEEALAKAQHGAKLTDPESSQTAEDKAVQILIDSPVTITERDMVAPIDPPINVTNPTEDLRSRQRVEDLRPRMSGLKKAALAAALLGAGGGIGAAVPLVIDALKPGTPATVPADNDTLYELQIGGDRP